MEDKLYVYMFRSRNKDNKGLENFKERVKTIVDYEYNEDKILIKYDRFVREGLPGEKTRLYKSVNARDEAKIREDIIIRLIKDKTPIPNMERLVASAAQQIENRAENKWLFDFDVDNEKLVDEFINDIKEFTTYHWDEPKTLLRAIEGEKAEKYKTPNGYAVVVNHGFDTRDLLKKWKDYDITLKRDELLFLRMEENK